MSLPQNLQLYFHDFCKDCELAELKLENYHTDHVGYTKYMVEGEEYELKCIHENVCLSYNKEKINE